MTYTFMFQVYNRPETIGIILEPFVQAQNDGLDCQLIVCDDGSKDNTGEVIKSAMNKANNPKQNTIMTFFDIYEIELTWRAMRIAEGEIVVWMQDDDYYETMQFAIEAKRIFDKYPEIAVLSPKHGYNYDKHMNFTGHWGDYPNSTDLRIHTQPNYTDNIMVVHAVNRAPFIFRRSEYEASGGIDRNLQIAAYSEEDLCFSCLERGLKTAIYHTDGFHFRRWPATSLKTWDVIGAGRPFNSMYVKSKYQKLLNNMPLTTFPSIINNTEI